MREHLCYICFTVASIFAVHVESIYVKKGHINKPRCFKEKYVFSMVARWLAETEKAFNENRITDIDDTSNLTVYMPDGSPTVVGRTAVEALRQGLRDNISDRAEITLIQATRVSCDRILMVEHIRFFKGDTVVIPLVRVLAVWKKQGKKWLKEVFMDNVAE